MTWRMERIGEQVRGELARLLRDEVSDPRIGMLTLTRVDVAPDLATASVFWSALDVTGDEDLEVVAQGLESASGFLRKRLAKELSLRRTPALRFHRDPSIERGAETLALLAEVREEFEARDGSCLPDTEECNESVGDDVNANQVLPTTPEKRTREDERKRD